MASRRTKLVLRLLIHAAAVIGLLALAGSAAAEATIQPINETESFSVPVSDNCRGGLPGVMTGTLVTTGELVVTPAGQPSHAQGHGTTTATFEIDYQDGSYAIGSFSDPFAFGGPFFPPQPIVFAETDVYVGTLTVYDANGQELGTETLHALAHFTVVNGETPSVRTILDTSHFTCQL